jgi:hypothetical protein
MSLEPVSVRSDDWMVVSAEFISRSAARNALNNGGYR